MSSNNNIIKGVHPLEEAMESGLEIQKIWIARQKKSGEIHQLINRARERKIPVKEVPSEFLNKFGKNHQGIVAWISPVSFHPLEEIIQQIYESGNSPFILYLDKITDVRNMGAICRSAYYFGVHAVAFPSNHSALINDEAVKASSGALLKLKLCRLHSPLKDLGVLKHSGLKIYAATEKGQPISKEIKLDEPLCLIMGSEHKGISTELLKISDKIIAIPGTGKLDSLNVSVAAGILLYEIFKSRTGK